MTEQELTELEELAAGRNLPWDEVAESGDWWIEGKVGENEYRFICSTEQAATADVSYIVKACNRVPKLIAEIRRLTAERNQLITTNAELRLRLERAQRKP